MGGAQSEVGAGWTARPGRLYAPTTFAPKRPRRKWRKSKIGPLRGGFWAAPSLKLMPGGRPVRAAYRSRCPIDIRAEFAL